MADPLFIGRVGAALSLTGASRGGTATTTATALATTWATSQTWAASQFIVNAGNVYRCTTAGNGATVGTGPTGIGPNVTDGAAILYGLGPFNNGMVLSNNDPANPMLWDFFSDKAGGFTLTFGQSVVLPVANPALIFVWVPTTSVAFSLAGLS